MRAVVLLLMTAVLVAATINSHNATSAQTHLALCASAAVRLYFMSDRQLLVSTTRNDGDLVDVLLRNITEITHWPLYVSFPGPEPPLKMSQEKISSYIIVTKGLEDFTQQIEKLTDNPSWNSRARFLVVVILISATPELLALSVMRELFVRYMIVNIVVLVQYVAMVNLYSFIPFQSKDHCTDVTDVILLNQWSMDGEGKFLHGGTLFPNTVVKNYNGCPVVVSTPFPGNHEDVFISAVLRLLNLTVIYSPDFPEDMTLYDKIRTSITDVAFGGSHVAYGGLPLLMEAAQVADPSIPYYEIRYTFYVPCARSLPRLHRISRIFSTPVWMAVFAAVFLVAVIIRYLASSSLEAHTYTNFSCVLYNVWAVVLGVSVTGMPRTYRLRLIILPWVCYCFAISTVFQTFFTSYLVDPGFEKQITTVDELVGSGIEFGHRQDFNVFYSDTQDWRYKILLNRRQDCSPVDTCIDRIIDTGSFATLGESWLVDDYLNNINDSSLVCQLNDDYFPIYLCTYFRKGFTFLEYCNQIILSAIESGLVVKADRDRFIRKKEPPTADIYSDYFVFTISHLHIAFYTLLVGDILSLFLLFFELLYSNKSMMIASVREFLCK